MSKRTARQAATQRKLYAERKARGVCPQCGRSAPAPGKIQCADCIRANLEATARHRARNPDKSWKYAIKHHYGLTVERWHEMLAAQGGRCAICGRTNPGGLARRLRVDHCHRTGAVRGLLCNDCNVGLGHFGDSTEMLRRAAEYLSKSRRRQRAAKEQQLSLIDEGVPNATVN